MKVAVIYPSPSKEDKETILRAFEAYKIPMNFYPTPSFDWKELVKKEHIVVVCCMDQEIEKVSSYLGALPHKPIFATLPLARYFKATANNSEARKQIAVRLKLLKHECDDLEERLLRKAQEITLDKEELADLCYTTILSLRNAKQAPLSIRVRSATGVEKIIKITLTKEPGAFTFEELLGVRLLMDLTNAREATVEDMKETVNGK
jgi:hypothetical protein